MSSSAPGISRASAAPCPRGKSGSSVPWTTSVGTSIAPRRSRQRSPPSSGGSGCPCSPRCSSCGRGRGPRARASPARRTGVSGSATTASSVSSRSRRPVRPVRARLRRRRRRERSASIGGRSGRPGRRDSSRSASGRRRVGVVERHQLGDAPPIETRRRAPARPRASSRAAGPDEVVAPIPGRSRADSYRAGPYRGGRSARRAAARRRRRRNRLPSSPWTRPPRDEQNRRGAPSPKVWTQRSTPLAWTIVGSMTVQTARRAVIHRRASVDQAPLQEERSPGAT